MLCILFGYDAIYFSLFYCYPFFVVVFFNNTKFGIHLMHAYLLNSKSNCPPTSTFILLCMHLLFSGINGDIQWRRRGIYRVE